MEVFLLLSDLTSPANASDDAITSESIVKMLKHHIKQGKSLQLPRYEFDDLVRLPHERLADFVATLKHLAGACRFGDDE